MREYIPRYILQDKFISILQWGFILASTISMTIEVVADLSGALIIIIFHKEVDLK